MRKQLALCACAAALVVPAFAAADATQSVSPADNQSPSAWFVQLSGTQDAFFAGAKKLGLNVTARERFKLWNGVSVTVPLGQAGALSSVSGVTAVSPVGTSSLEPEQTVSNPDDLFSNPMIGVDATNGGVGPYQGQNVKVAVVDSGLDYTNPDLGGCAHIGAGCRVTGGYDFVGDLYDDNPADLAYNPVPAPDNDPAPCDPNFADARVTAGLAGLSNAGHGTHVAGIIGAKAASPTGVTGVAPQVQFLAYKVFGCNGSVDNDIVMAALERAYADGAQVINLSLGADYESWPEDPEAQLTEELVRRGVVVVAAEGNAGGPTSGIFSNGTPAVAPDVIAVGSLGNTRAFFNRFDVNGTLHPYVQAASAPPGPLSGSGTLVTMPDVIGCAAEAPHSLDGKIALIRRGTCSFYVKAIQAQNAGAVAVVLYNNVAGPASPTVAPGAGNPPVTIPVVLTPLADGTAIAAIAGTRTLTWTDNGAYVPQATGGLTSSFSSWGPTAELGLKPDVTAPGGSIRSTWPMTQFGGHNLLSGTSMSSPHVAGAAAVLLSAGKSPAQVSTLLSNNAEPALWSGSPAAGLLESPFRQGAGLVQVDRALAATSTVSPRRIALGEGLGGSQILTITNNASTPVTYNLTATSAIAVVPTGTGWPNTWSSLTGFDQGEDSVTFSAPSVTVPAGGQAFVTASVHVAPATPTGETYGGFIQLLPSGAGPALTVPYGGFAGDYQSKQVLTNGGVGFPWLARLSDTTPTQITGNGATFTLAGDDKPTIVYQLNLPAREVDVQVENADGSFVQPVFNYAAKFSYVPRNHPTATGGPGFFTFAWDGTRGQDNGNDKTKVVPNGTYRLKLSVLKPLGDANNPADWETFTTPAFSVARP